ncbi:MAG: hypothetical protein LBJ83_03380 [Oscillospiraceae bacterium]|jgi:YQGE family putative transporter|nr:hypothetical protein [Oscillospiraceae bacterium]
MRFTKQIYRAKEYIRAFLGIDFLPQKFSNFLWVHIGFLLLTSVINLLANTLFPKIIKNEAVVLFFHAVVSALTPLGTILSMFLLKHTSFSSNSKISFILFAILQIIFLFLVHFQNPLFLPLIAILNALANGFYWVTYSLFITKHITNSQRNRSVSIIGMLSGFITIVVPLFSGFVISIFQSLSGYIIVILFSIVVIFFVLNRSQNLSKNPISPEQTQFKRATRLVFSNKIWYTCSITEFLKGLREGPFSFYLSLLLFSIIRKESIISINMFAMGVVTAISNKLYGQNRKMNDFKYMAVATHALTFMTILFLIKPGVITVLALGLSNAFFNLYIVNPVMKSFYFLANASQNGKLLTPELFSIRSCFLAAGRVLGIFLIFSVSKLTHGIPIAMLLLTLAQYVTLLLCKKTLSNFNNSN